jgi:hypothetical protein
MQELRRKLNKVHSSKEWWALGKEYSSKPFTVGMKLTAEELRQHFESLLNPQRTHCIHSAAFPFINDEILDADVNTEEVFAALKKLKDGKAPGEDRISYEFFKYATFRFHTALANAYNVILNTGNVDDLFFRSLIFPIFKKGDPNIPRNYRGITFMNCAAKLYMAILNQRLMKWVQEKGILNEYQAGFRPNYSTIDNIYNLSSIIQLKFNEKKRVYAFFVDFEAAFDNVPRDALMLKLSNMGVSTKFLNQLSTLYKGTLSAVWNGKGISKYFETRSGVKQGCLLSPLLFALFINDLHEVLGEGLNIEGLNLRILMYADDIVILADDPRTLQNMIVKLERYCHEWNMSVNRAKSKIMVFRRGGRHRYDEQWTFNGLPLEIVKSYVYLGVTFTPKMSFTEHIQERSKKAKTCLYATWTKLLSDQSVKIEVKTSIFKAVIRAIQCYSAQIFGCYNENLVNKLQIFFYKFIFRLPTFTPTYALFLEIKDIPSSIYCLKLHMEYINRTIFEYEEDRLPYILSHKIVQKKIYWFDAWCKMENKTLIRWNNVPFNKERWKQCTKSAVENTRIYYQNQSVIKKNSSQHRFYQKLNHNKLIIGTNINANDALYVVKARLDVLNLNGNKFEANADKRCTLCDLNVIENLHHFFGVCPKLREFRIQAFQTYHLSEQEVIRILDGEVHAWNTIAWYIRSAINYRRDLVNIRT